MPIDKSALISINESALHERWLMANTPVRVHPGLPLYPTYLPAYERVARYSGIHDKLLCVSLNFD